MYHSIFITHWYPNLRRPSEGIFIREQARALSLFDQVSVIAVEGRDPQAKPPFQIQQEFDGALTVYRLRYPASRWPKTTWIRRWQGVRTILQRLMSTGPRPDILHAHIYSSADLAAVFGRIYHLPAVLTEHASSYPRRLFSAWERLKLGWFVNRMAYILPVSQDLANHMQRYGLRGPFKVIPNTVDADLFWPAQAKPSTSPRLILHVASLMAIKAQDKLLEALRLLRNRRQDFCCVLIGEGNERPRLEALIQALGLADCVQMPGAVAHEEVGNWLRRADLFVLSSLWENQPAALLEALMCGVPVVAPAVGGIPEVITPSNGCLFEAGNVASLASSLDEALERFAPAPALEISQAAQERFSYPAVGRQIHAIYQRVIEHYEH